MTKALPSIEIRVRGRVQGVGFRPHVYRLAVELGLAGEVLNDAEGVLIRASGPARAMDAFLARIPLEGPPLARIQSLETRALQAPFSGVFRIAESALGEARTQVAPDARICDDCTTEILSSHERRFRYPFATCTHCGPRLTIVRAIPYDRGATTMAPFALCPACNAEYQDVTDRRFHAETIACHRCGPKARLVRADGTACVFGAASACDDIDAALTALREGAIVAIKGLGGYHLACDATRSDAVERLRVLKRRDAKPFAMMARDLDVIRRYCRLSTEEAHLLASPEGPIVLLEELPGPPDAEPWSEGDAEGGASPFVALSGAVAPGHRTLGLMLPTTPLHALLLSAMDRPVVMTSGNLGGSPSIIDDEIARERLGSIADCMLVHDRVIANRVDDSVVRFMNGLPCVLRRARGYAPSAIRLPNGFEGAPSLLAYGGDLKSTFCLVARSEAILSPHLGDLEEVETFGDYEKAMTLHRAVFGHRPQALVVDRHPDYEPTRLARERSRDEGIPLIETQHHHAHVASCLVDNGYPLGDPPVLGIVLDGLGFGDAGELWGGEFLLADYHHYQRIGTFKPVALLGGDEAAREPWRNLYAHIMAEMGWAELMSSFPGLELTHRLAAKPRAILDRMLEHGINSPQASSCGRLFDAVAAAMGAVFERQAYEGQAGALLESLVDDAALRDQEEHAYPFSISHLPGDGLPYVEPIAMWRSLLADVATGAPPGVMSARFHRGLAAGITTMVDRLRVNEVGEHRFGSVVLSGGCFQNRLLFEETTRRLRAEGLRVLTHRSVPPNDGGLSLGQAAIAAARLVSAP